MAILSHTVVNYLYLEPKFMRRGLLGLNEAPRNSPNSVKVSRGLPWALLVLLVQFMTSQQLLPLILFFAAAMVAYGVKFVFGKFFTVF